MIPKCPICDANMYQLYFADGTPDNLWECKNYCKVATDQVIRVQTDENTGEIVLDNRPEIII